MSTVASSGEPQLKTRLQAIIERLDHYAARLERLRDSRAVFTRLYVDMTRALERELPTRNWNDAGWIVRLAEAFSARYVDALDAFDAGREPSQAWEILMSTMRRRRTSVLQDLVAGMVGHIVHDLPFALCDLVPGGASGDLAPHIADYQQMNDVLGDAIDRLKRDVERRFDPWLRWLDRLVGKTDDILTDYGIRLSRAAAWYNACRLLDPAARAEALASLEASPVAFLNELFNPPLLPVRLAVRTVSTAVSWGRRWPMPPVPAVAASPATPNQRYYFSTGAGTWRGTFRYSITSFGTFMRAKLGLTNKLLALGMAATMLLFRRARIDSRIDAYPDQGPLGVATNDVRISLFGVRLYTLLEQYALAADGEAVFVRSYERFGPFPLLLNREKKHPAKVTDGGAHATYYDMPLLGDTWTGRYTVSGGGKHVESTLTCPWATATETIDKQ
jgi:hypothetical protein